MRAERTKTSEVRYGSGEALRGKTSERPLDDRVLNAELVGDARLVPC